VAGLPSAAPPSGARVLAVVSILVAGLCGGMIGFSVVDLSDPDAGAKAALGALIGAVFAAGGVAIVAVLVLRAMTEWHSMNRDENGRATGPDGRGSTGRRR
jgi:hypothetical protein